MEKTESGILFLHFEDIIFNKIIQDYKLKIKSIEIPDFVELKMQEKFT